MNIINTFLLVVLIFWYDSIIAKRYEFFDTKRYDKQIDSSNAYLMSYFYMLIAFITIDMLVLTSYFFLYLYYYL